jgi:hypothetical protein
MTAPAQVRFQASHPAALVLLQVPTDRLVLLSLLALPAVASGFRHAAVAARQVYQHALLMLLQRAAAVVLRSWVQKVAWGRSPLELAEAADWWSEQPSGKS